MPLTVDDSNAQIVTLRLDGVLTEADFAGFADAVRSHLARARGPVAFLVDALASDGGMDKHRKLLGDFFSATPKPPFGRCAGMAVVTQTEGQQSFLRDVVASGAIPFPYRFFVKDFEATTWLRSRLKAAES